MIRRRLAFILAAFFLCAVASMRAHDPGLSIAQAQVRGATIELTVAFAPADAQALVPPAQRIAGKWTAAEFEKLKPLLTDLAPALWEVQAGGKILKAGGASVDHAEGDSMSFRLSFPRPEAGETIGFRALKLDVLPPGHRCYFTASDEQGALAEKLLSAKNAAVDTVLRTSASAAAPRAADETVSPSARGFVRLGVQHIWEGYDHLLFLFGLLVVCRNFKSIVGIITCFTLAHSLTLALDTLNLVTLPGRFVEPMIAASIVFVGVENLVRRGEEPKGRWALTFVFGLIHGFGFASVLRDLGVGQGGRGLAMPLFTFNLGVELGQVAVAAVVLPIVWQLRKNETFLRHGVPALSAIVALAGLYWLVERTLFTW